METLTNKRQQHGRHKQTLTNKRQRRSDSPAAAPGPRWLILNSCIDDEGGDSSVADAKTTAASCTPSGKPFSISFGIAAPPACCSLYFDWQLGGITPGDSDGKHSESEPEHVRVIAGHDDALLIQMRRMRVLKAEVRRRFPFPYQAGSSSTTTSTRTFDDHFLYQAGGGTRPPSLLQLPGCYIPVQNGYRNISDRTPKYRNLSIKNTGILRRGKDDLVVCQYEMTCDPPVYDMADLCMLRIGRDRDWIVKRVPILEHRDGSSELQPWRWQPHRDIVADAVVPVGNRFLCWVDYSIGFLVCDTAEEEISKLRYVRRPEKTRHNGYCGHYSGLGAYCTLGAASPDVVRFVSISPPRCCYGDYAGQTYCEGSSSSFKVTTWTMTLSMEGTMTWVKDVVLDCNEIWKWRLPNYGCLPRDKHLEYPMVSSDDPDVIYFMVEGMAVAINTRSKKLLSAVPSGGTRHHFDLRQQRSIMAKLCW